MAAACALCPLALLCWARALALLGQARPWGQQQGGRPLVWSVLRDMGLAKVAVQSWAGLQLPTLSVCAQPRYQQACSLRRRYGQA